MLTKLLLPIAGLSLLGLSTLAVGAVQHARSSQDHGSRGRALLARQHPGFAGRLRERFEARRELIKHRIGERLGVTDAQREQFRAQAQVMRPAADQFRTEARAILQRARDSAASGDHGAQREQTRAELKALFERYYPQFESSASTVVGALTPEQREKLAKAAAARGRTLDEERMKHVAAFMLLRRSRSDAETAR
jgi:hypothetical protein